MSFKQLQQYLKKCATKLKMSVCNALHQDFGLSLAEQITAAVILAISAGGLMAYITIQKEARIKVMIGDLQELTKSIQWFYDSLGYYPGDIPSSALTWDIKACGGYYGFSGNGDNFVGIVLIRNASSTVDVHFEGASFWCHLYMAGMMDQKYSVQTDYARPPIPGQELPRVKGMSNAGYFVDSYRRGINKMLSHQTNYLMAATPSLIVATPSSIRDLMHDFRHDGLFTGAEMNAIDKKYDDGDPNTGLIIASCMNAADPGNCPFNIFDPTQGQQSTVYSNGLKYNINNTSRYVVPMIDLGIRGWGTGVNMYSPPPPPK